MRTPGETSPKISETIVPPREGRTFSLPAGRSQYPGTHGA
jgi:hypothetical protein